MVVATILVKPNLVSTIMIIIKTAVVINGFDKKPCITLLQYIYLAWMDYWFLLVLLLYLMHWSILIVYEPG